jgi:hypothetical protein
VRNRRASAIRHGMTTKPSDSIQIDLEDAYPINGSLKAVTPDVRQRVEPEPLSER